MENLSGDDLSVLKSIKQKVSKNYRFLRRAEDHLPGERDLLPSAGLDGLVSI